jgi:tetratricopeptide (TPR) repeat protein
MVAKRGREVLQARVKTRILPMLGLMSLTALLLGGCDHMFDHKGENALNMAHEQEKEGDYRAAIQWYEASLDGTPATAESDYNMALIYDDKLDNPVAALDHFRRYMELAPNGEHAADAKSFADQDVFKLVNTLGNGNFMPQQDAARLKNQNFELQQELTAARKEISDMREAAKVTLGTKGGHTEEPIEKPIPPGARTYRVEPGDTLRSISRMFYKTPSRWQDIQDANFGVVDGTVKLKVGMELQIP